MKKVLLASAALFAMALPALAGGPPPTKNTAAYQVIDLNPLLSLNADGSLAQSSSSAINDSGEVVFNANSGSYAFLGSKTLKVISMKGNDAVVYASRVNANSVALGNYYTKSGSGSYTQDLTTNYTSVVPGFFGSGLNDSGVIAGSTYDDAGSQAGLYVKGQLVRIPQLDSTGLSDFGLQLNSWAVDVNNRGVAVGGYTLSTDDYSFSYEGAWVSDGKSYIEIPSLGGEFVFPADINNGATVIGIAETAEGNPHAFLWSPFGRQTKDLGTLGGSYSSAEAVNDLNQVVGQSSISDNYSQAPHAFLWKRGRMVDLNTMIDPNLGLVVIDASGINRSGQIAASVVTSDGSYHAVLLTPTATRRRGNPGTPVNSQKN